MRRLNFGSGGQCEDPTWDHVDRNDYGDRAIRHDITTGPLPIDDNTYDYAVAHHSLQALVLADVVPALTELRRVLVPGGVLRVSVPDVVEGFMRYIIERDRSWFPNTEEPTVGEAFTRWITWGGQNVTCFVGPSLQSMMGRAGFSAVRRSRFGRTEFGSEDGIVSLDTRESESLFYEGVK